MNSMKAVYMNYRSMKRTSRFIVAVSILMLITCCGGHHTGHHKSTPNPEELTFKGSYNVQAAMGTCGNESFVFTIGNDSSKADRRYLFIPDSLAEGTISYDFPSEGITGDVSRTVKISDHKIIMEDIMNLSDIESLTEHLVFTFSDDYSSFAISGSLTDTDFTKCYGTILGNGTKQ
ncbi:MAG TPA: hypothetical protein VMU10_01160 [Desulfomonilia bacterium]|nr:hypothetical protein [Desulfomonilia bacterium]